MIARLWHGVTLASQAEPYLDYLLNTGVPDYQATAGNRGVYVLRQIDGDEAHFLLLSLWDSREAIQAFAGADLERARYYPADQAFLLTLEPKVRHYEVCVRP